LVRKLHFGVGAFLQQVEGALDGKRPYSSGVLTVVVLLLTLAPFILPAIPVGTDLPKHVLVAHIINQYDGAAYRYPSYFSLESGFHSTMLGEYVMAALCRYVDPFVGAKLYLALFVLMLWAGAWLLVRRLGYEPEAAILVLPLAHTFCVFSGFLPFIMSVALFPFLLTLLLDERRTPGRALALAAVVAIGAGLHLVAAAVGVFVVLGYTLCLPPSHPRRWLNVLATLPTLALLGVSLLYRNGADNRFHWYPPLGQIKQFLGYNAWTLSLTAGLCFLLLAALLGLALLRQVLQGTARTPLAALSASLVAIGVVLPYQVGDWFVVGARTFPFSAILALASLRLSKRARLLGVCSAVAFLSISGVLNARAALAVQPLYRSFLEGMASIPMGSRVLPVIGDISLGGNTYIQPFAGMEDAYTIYRGGSNPYVLASAANGAGIKTTGTILRYKQPPRYGFKYVRGAHNYDGACRSYDYAVVFHAEPERLPGLTVGATEVLRKPNLAIYRYDRCR
jgi:hypothetical protein